MTFRSFVTRAALVAAALAGLTLLTWRNVQAHCDTLDGPVVITARAALDRGDVTPILKWVRKEDESEIRTAFAKALAVRTKGPDARDLADTYFFETLVRVHRAGEGAPFTGLKPAGTDLGAALIEADKALETGSADALVALLTTEIAAGVRERFARASALKLHAHENVAAGREFVEAYVSFVHYVEALSPGSEGEAARHGGPEGAASDHAHTH